MRTPSKKSRSGGTMLPSTNDDHGQTAPSQMNIAMFKTRSIVGCRVSSRVWIRNQSLRACSQRIFDFNIMVNREVRLSDTYSTVNAFPAMKQASTSSLFKKPHVPKMSNYFSPNILVSENRALWVGTHRKGDREYGVAFSIHVSPNYKGTKILVNAT